MFIVDGSKYSKLDTVPYIVFKKERIRQLPEVQGPEDGDPAEV